MSRELESARKQALFAAITAMIIGASVIVVVGVVHFLFAGTLAKIAGSDSGTMVFQLVRALKAFLWVNAALGLILIGVGGVIIEFFSKAQRIATRTPHEQ